MIKLSISNLPISVSDKANATNLTPKYSMLCNLKEFSGTVHDIAEIINKGHIVIPATFREKKLNAKGQYTRCYANFEDINTLFIDIDNQEEITILNENGKKDRVTIKYKVGDEKHISIEKAKEVLNQLELDYFMIYTTMSHSEEQHKFRIGFLLNEPITDIQIAKKIYFNLGFTLKELGVDVDARALEPSRLFYPGNVLEVKENSYLDIEKLKIPNDSKGKKKVSKTKIKTISKETKVIKNLEVKATKKLDITLDKILKYINSKVCKHLEIDFTNRYDELNRIIDLTDIFEVSEDEKFSCIFHSDSNPSAYIYRTEEGITTYHCFSCDERLNGVQLIKKLFDLDEYSFIKTLEDNTYISIGSKYQKQARDIVISMVFYVIDRKGLEKDNEIVFKYLSRRNLIATLELIYILAGLNTTIDSLSQYENGVTFFSSVSFVTAEYNRKYNSNLKDENIRLKINALANLGLITKLDIEELKDNVKENCKAWMVKNSYVKYPNFYYLVPITPSLLEKAEEIILLEKKAGVKAKNQCKKQATVIQNDVADQIYVQNKKEYNVDEEILFNELNSYLNSLDKNYFEFEDLIISIDKHRKYKKSYKEKQVEIYLTKLALEDKIEKVKCSKANKIKYDIPENFTHYNSVYVVKDLDKKANGKLIRAEQNEIRREKIKDLLAQGLSQRKIAEEMGISLKTVVKHIQVIKGIH